MKKREHRLAPRRHDGGEGPSAPTFAMYACVCEAADQWGRKLHDVHVKNTSRAGSDDFFVEVAAGEQRASCEVGAKEKIHQMHKGRL